MFRFAMSPVRSIRQLSTIVALNIIVLLTGFGSNESVASLNTTAQWKEPFNQIAVGLCEDYPEESRTLEGARRDLEVLRTNNIRVLRIAFGWDAMEPEQGKFDFTFWDDFVRMASDEFGITLIPYVCYTPKWASQSDHSDYWKHPPKENAMFASFVQTLVKRYKDRIHSWELWNEPDNPAYWVGSTEQFAAMLKAGSGAVRAADPGAKVVTGGIAWNLEFLRELFEKHNVSPFVDVVNVHNYYETWSADPVEDLPNYIRRAKSIVSEFGNGQAIWMAEIGYSSFRRGNFVSEIYNAHFEYEHTERYQAATVFRALTETASTGDVPLVAWYRVNDLPGDEKVIGDVNNRHLGVLGVSGAAKPALSALRFWCDLFTSGARCIDDRTVVSRNIATDSEVHVFEVKNGKVLVVAWLRAVPRKEGAGGIDRRKEKLEITVSATLTGHAVEWDVSGKRKGTVPIVHSNNATRLPGITLIGGEVRVFTIEQRITLSR